MELILAVLGIVAGWAISHLYYRRSIQDLETSNANLQEKLDKLPTQVVQLLADEQRRKLTLEEIEELIQEADATPTQFGLFPNKCPKCGEATEIRGSDPTDYSEAEAWPYCPSCGWGG